MEKTLSSRLFYIQKSTFLQNDILKYTTKKLEVSAVKNLQFDISRNMQKIKIVLCRHRCNIHKWRHASMGGETLTFVMLGIQVWVKQTVLWEIVREGRWGSILGQNCVKSFMNGPIAEKDGTCADIAEKIVIPTHKFKNVLIIKSSWGFCAKGLYINHEQSNIYLYRQNLNKGYLNYFFIHKKHTN